MSMIDLTRKLALGASLAALCGTAAFAQETAPTAEAPAATTEEAPRPADTPTPDGLSMGVEEGGTAAAGPKTQENAEVGETYLAGGFELWEQRCIKEGDGSDPCQLYQLLKDGSGNSVAEFSMFPLAAGGEAAAGATIIVPLETLLTANLVLTIDGGKAKVYPYSFCAPIGCIARVGFTTAEVDQFKKGAKAVMTLVPAVAPDQKVSLDISLKGFTAGYDAVAASLAKN